MKSKHGKYLNCKFCNTPFYVKPYQINVRKFCSHKCYGNWKKGREEFKYWLGKIRPDMSGDKNPSKRLAVRKKLSKANKGKKLTTETKIKLRKSMEGRFAGNKHWNWKGGKFYKSKSTDRLTYFRNHNHEYEHRLIAEKMIGRKLGKKEVVHHVDGNTLNNSPENLMVFKTNGEHLKFHHRKEVII